MWIIPNYENEWLTDVSVELTSYSKNRFCTVFWSPTMTCLITGDMLFMSHTKQQQVARCCAKKTIFQRSWALRNIKTCLLIVSKKLHHQRTPIQSYDWMMTLMLICSLVGMHTQNSLITAILSALKNFWRSTFLLPVCLSSSVKAVKIHCDGDEWKYSSRAVYML